MTKLLHKLHKKRIPLILVDPSHCKRCGICIHFCPTGVFDAREDGLPLVNRREDCIWCNLCEVRCPDFAILLKPEEDGEDSEVSAAAPPDGARQAAQGGEGS